MIMRWTNHPKRKVQTLDDKSRCLLVCIGLCMIKLLRSCSYGSTRSSHKYLLQSIPLVGHRKIRAKRALFAVGISILDAIHFSDEDFALRIATDQAKYCLLLVNELHVPVDNEKIAFHNFNASLFMLPSCADFHYLIILFTADPRT